jgi:hypothetical protein
MQRRHLAWILLPAAIVAIAVVAVVVSSYQKEAGIAVPGEGARAAVAAAAEARDAASGQGATAYQTFSSSLAVALSETRNIGVTNPAETRVTTALTNTLDCLSASREVWQAQLEQAWDQAYTSPGYWQTVHPALSAEKGGAPAELQPTGTLTAEQVREWAVGGADYWLQKALALVQ